MKDAPLRAVDHAWLLPAPSHGYLVVRLAIAKLANGDPRNECWPGNSYLARRCQMKKRNLQYILKELEEAGEIAISRGTGRFRGRIRYLFKSINLAMVEIEAEGCNAVHPRDATDCASGVQSTAPESESLIRTKSSPDIACAKGEKPEQTRMTLLAAEPGGAHESQEHRVRRQIAEAKAKRSAG